MATAMRAKGMRREGAIIAARFLCDGEGGGG